jgi:hypothetical protein
MEPADAEAVARTILSDVLREADFGEPGSDRELDFRVSSDDVTLAVTVKATRRREVDAMEGRLATGILEWQKRPVEEGEVPLLMLYAPRVGRRAIRELEAFMTEFSDGMAWGVFDDRGTVCLRIQQLDIEVTEFGEETAEKGRQTTHNKRAFTDFNRWFLKILLLRNAPEGMWHRDPDHRHLRKPVENPAQLESIAHVGAEQTHGRKAASQAKVYQFARTFRDLGYLRWGSQDFEVIRRSELFDAWSEDEKQMTVERHPVRSIFGAGATVEDIFSDVGREVQYAIGGFEACRLHGVLHAPRQTPEIHIFQNVNRVVHALDLEVCPEHEADLHLISLPYHESIRRGTLHRDELRVVDILQAALDAGRHPTRGREQADYIVDEVLGWN